MKGHRVIHRSKYDNKLENSHEFKRLLELLESGRVDPGRLMAYLEDDPGDAHPAPGHQTIIPGKKIPKGVG